MPPATCHLCHCRFPRFSKKSGEIFWNVGGNLLLHLSDWNRKEGANLLTYESKDLTERIVLSAEAPSRFATPVRERLSSVKVVLKTPWSSCFRGVLLVTLPLQLRKQWRLRAAAQRRPSELASAFTLHSSCNVNLREKAHH